MAATQVLMASCWLSAVPTGPPDVRYARRAERRAQTQDGDATHPVSLRVIRAPVAAADRETFNQRNGRETTRRRACRRRAGIVALAAGVGRIGGRHGT